MNKIFKCNIKGCTFTSPISKLVNHEKHQPHNYCLMAIFKNNQTQENGKIFNMKHMTILYSKILNIEEVLDIIEIVKKYRNEFGCKEIEAEFTEKDFFGPNKDIPVLKSKIKYFEELRNRLQKYQNEDFLEYKPHVTLYDDNNLEYFKDDIVRIELKIAKGKTIHRWHLLPDMKKFIEDIEKEKNKIII